MDNQNFDWVTAVSACSLATAWEKLILDLESDVSIRNAELRARDVYLDFKVTRRGSLVSVYRDKLDLTMPEPNAIIFRLQESAINVKRSSNNETILEATVRLNLEGECKFFIGQEEHESWQIRMMALRELFFEI